MKAGSTLRGLIAVSPRRLLAVLATIFAVLVPAAVAWACTPQATIFTDKTSYKPSEQMTVSGRYFSGRSVTITSEPAGIHAEGVPVDSTDGFQTQLGAPDRPGSYTLLARSSDTPEFVGRTAFEVEAAPGRCANEKLGTQGADNLTGLDAGDRIFAFAGNDVVNALAADDCVDGGSGADRLSGGLGHDTVVAQGGNDQASGQDGNDRLLGGDGNDRLGGGPGRDTLAGGKGGDVLTGQLGDDHLYAGTGRNGIDAGTENDYVSARNGSIDAINCGRGRDTARVDPIDRTAGCERVIRG